MIFAQCVEIEGKAALLLSPPDDEGYVKKDHLCVSCYEQTVAEYETVKHAIETKVAGAT